MAIVQHIPPMFSAAFAERLNRICAIRVREARNGDMLERGLALIAPGDTHMVVRRSPRGLMAHITGGPRVCYHRPSVDVLFCSVAEAVGSKAVGVILTGMGNDGAAGLAKMRFAGAHTIGQDEQSCVVWGMPREAQKAGAVEQVLPLDRIGNALCAAWSARPAARVN
jgi:two-component system chemotaxis response regulator CheB